MIQVGFGVQVAKTSTYPVVCRITLFVALCDDIPPTLQTDRQTDVMLIDKCETLR